MTSLVSSPHFCSNGRLGLSHNLNAIETFDDSSRRTTDLCHVNADVSDKTELLGKNRDDKISSVACTSDNGQFSKIICPCYSSDSYSSPKLYGTESSDVGKGIIYCVHGKPEGCCATVISPPQDNNDSNINGIDNSSSSPPVTLFEDHCHQYRKENIDSKARTKLICASVLCLFFMIVEIIGGILSSSLAIATDAAHLLTDFGSFMISLFAIWVGSRPATRNMPFGWYRAEVLGAFTSVLMIWIVTGILLYIAVKRVINLNFVIDAEFMLTTSIFGVFVNIIMACILHQHHHHNHTAVETEQVCRQSENINVRAAYVHVVGDFLQSFGVLVASLIIFYKPEWKIVDPICTFLFSILVLFTTITILKDTMVVLMEGIPRGIDYSDVLNTFTSIDDVMKVHNLRIWALSLDKTALAAPLAVRPGVNTSTVLKMASRNIHQKFNFFEMTLQIEEFHEQMDQCEQCQDALT